MSTNLSFRKIPVTTVLAFLALLVSLETNGQSVRRQNIASTCSASTLNSLTICFTGGQPYNTSITAGYSLGFLPGFQQPLQVAAKPQISENSSISAEVYPNPASDYVTFKCSEPSEKTFISITDSRGNLIFNDITGSVNEYKINCLTWSNGVYFISLTDNNLKKSTIKLIINK